MFRRLFAHLKHLIKMYLETKSLELLFTRTMKNIFTLAFALLAFSAVKAQSSLAASVETSTLLAQWQEKDLPEYSDQSFEVFLDEENRVCYIDFEALPINLTDVLVKRSQSGEVVWREEVFDLPVNTIYELDFEKLGTGEFEVELRSFAGVIRRGVTIP